MSGHFSKRIYDDSYFPEIVRQQTTSGNYRVYNGFADNGAKCHASLGPRANRLQNTGELSTGGLTKRAEVESLLTNRGWDSTKTTAPNVLAVKNAALKAAHESFKQNNRLCGKFMEDNHSRLELNIKDYTYADYNRWVDVIIEPREWVYYGNKVKTDKDRFGVQTRYETKKILDNFNKKLRVNA